MKSLLSIFALLCLMGTVNAQPAPPDTAQSPAEYLEALKWRSIGPFRGGRSVTSCGVIGDPLTYYMGTTGGGLWKTTDAGQRWNNISDGFFKTGSVGAVAVAPSNSNIVYCGMGEHAPRGVQTSYGDGVYKSYDAGKTWTHIGLTESEQIARIVVHPENPDVVFVAAQGALHGPSETRGIYRSTDGGKTWTNVLYVNETTGCAELSMDKTNPNVMYAAMWDHQRKPWKVISGGDGSGLYKSTDGGQTWKTIHNGLPEPKGKMAVAVSPANPDKVYAVIESDTEKELGGLFVSNNGGDSWNRISGDHRLVQRAWYYIEVFADPVNENMVYVLSAPALRSIDGGKTWERLSGTHGDYHDLWINPDNPKNLCIANDGGAAISFNRGGTWSTQATMPTAQFYRINVDNHFPYRIYGGQQDNSSIRIENHAVGDWGLDRSNWTPSAGGESAFLAFDPDNPRYVLGGSYLGTIEVMDMEANASTEIMAAPIQYLGRAARDMKYRYNWNAPIIWSQHEPNTYYHAAQLLLRTRDMGVTWEEVSPVLSRNEDEKLGYGGGPFTNEAVGAENYGTIAYVIESPHAAGEIWTSSDDGMVWLTRDGCETWTDVTPAGLEECLINAIDISPHNPGTAYIATTRYKFNDKTPALYKTTDYGASWINITEGIPYGAYTRVIREDDVRPGLLYAGTETGVYVSWDDGGEWHPLQLNLPVVPIHDLQVHRGDLIAGTSGRSIWILDDLNLLRQIDGPIDTMAFFKPATTMLMNGGSDLNGNKASGSDPFYGVNPATEAVLYYNLPDLPDSVTVQLTIKDASGSIVRSLTSERDEDYKRYDGGPPSEDRPGTSEGLNRFVWDLRHGVMPGVKDVYIEGSYRGHKVIPGDYTITLQAGDDVVMQTLTVVDHPMYDISAEDYKEYDVFMGEMEREITRMHDLVNEMDDTRNRIDDILETIPAGSEYDQVRNEGKDLVKRMKDWDELMVQRKAKAYDDVENYENKFTANYLFLINASESSIPKVNEASKQRKQELGEQWVLYERKARQMIQEDISRLNKTLMDKGVGSIDIKPLPRS